MLRGELNRTHFWLF